MELAPTILKAAVRADDRAPAPLVSVVIPTFNMGDFIGDALRSALHQTYSPCEVIVVDDGSTDNTAAVVQGFGDAVRYIWQENAGGNVARNRGVRAASGEFIAFLDADDVWKPTKVERQMALARGPAAVPVVGCGYVVQNLQGTETYQTIVRPSFPSHRELQRALRICQLIPGSGSGVLVARRCFDEVGYFDESLLAAQDWDMWLRLVDRFDAKFVEEVLVVIRKNNRKPSYRTLANEERNVRKVIEKNVPASERNRALALMHARLGRSYLAEGKLSEGFQHLIRSIARRPAGIFPVDLRNRYDFPRVPRFYLLARALWRAARRPTSA